MRRKYYGIIIDEPVKDLRPTSNACNDDTAGGMATLLFLEKSLIQ